jgi:cytoskeleton protein RodZ
MFEIGSSLREARMRRGFELSDVERDTRIRPRYLTALEEERFDILPGPAYVKGFLRTYADYLGLDAQQFIDEYNTRFAPPEEPAGAVPERIRRPRRFAPWLLGVGAALILALIGWQLGRGHTQRAAHSAPITTHVRTHVLLPPRPAKRTVTNVRLVLLAARGRCWITARIGSANGPVVFERTLEEGQSTRFVGARLWLRVGAPWNLDATLNGKHVQLPGSVGNVIVSSAGIASG